MSLSSLFVLFASAGATSTPEVPEPWRSETTAQLAAKLLPPEVAREAVSHRVAPPIFAGQPPFSVVFYTAAKPLSDGFCQRRTYYVASPAETPNVLRGDQIRIGGCPAGPDPLLASVQPGTSTEKAKQSLTWLQWAQGVARGRRPLPFELECTSPLKPDPCAEGARATLARLPLQGTFIVGKMPVYQGGAWQFAITPTRPPSTYWDVQVKTDASQKTHVRMTWDVPPPF